MPSLIRFVITIGVLAAIAYGAMYALVIFVEPKEREVTIRIPQDQIQPVALIKPRTPTPVEATQEEQTAQ